MFSIQGFLTFQSKLPMNYNDLSKWNLASEHGPNCRNGVFGSEQIEAGCRRGAYPLSNCGGDSDGDFYIDNLICFNFECNSNKSLFATCQTSS